MYKKLHIIALVPNSDKYTVYLFEKEEKYVIPVDFSASQAKQLLRPSAQEQNQPSIYNTARRLICGLGGNLISVLIYKYDAGVFYTYLNVATQNKKLDFNANIADALNIAKRFSAPIYIKNEVLDGCGFKVTRQILRDALAEGY